MSSILAAPNFVLSSVSHYNLSHCHLSHQNDKEELYELCQESTISNTCLRAGHWTVNLKLSSATKSKASTVYTVQ